MRNCTAKVRKNREAVVAKYTFVVVKLQEFFYVIVVRLQSVVPLPLTFVFAQWWAFETVFVPRDQTLNEDINL